MKSDSRALNISQDGAESAIKAEEFKHLTGEHVREFIFSSFIFLLLCYFVQEFKVTLRKKKGSW